MDDPAPLWKINYSVVTLAEAPNFVDIDRDRRYIPKALRDEPWFIPTSVATAGDKLR